MPAPPVSSRRVDASMSLLADLSQHAEDPAYAAAAARPRTGSPRRTAVGVLLVALVGLATGTAAAAVRTASDDGGQRAGLAREVARRTAQTDALARQEAALRGEVALLRDAALAGEDGGPTSGQGTVLRQLELAAGTVAVAGPGVVVTLDDRPDDRPDPALPRGGQAGAGRVLDRDLQRAVNGLWAAGAEAVSINDQRLTARTAIRSAGEAVLVDFRPLSPPYVVRALGDPGRLEPTFADGPAGRQLAAYTSLYGLRLTVTTEPDLRPPAGRVAEPRSVLPAGAP